MFKNNSIWEDVLNEFKSGNALSQLIIINIGVYLAVLIVKIIINLFISDPLSALTTYQTFITFIASTSDVGTLIFKPWTIITYMFLHENFLHILFNMLWLYWLGKILKDNLGNDKILPLYILGGLSGVFFYILAYNLLPTLSPYAESSIILGASAGVTAIVFAAAAYLPNFSIYLLFLGAVRLKYIALAFIILDLISIANLNNTGGHIAHIGGAVIGLLYVNQLKKGHDWAVSFYNLLTVILNFFKSDREKGHSKRKKTGVNKNKKSSSGYQTKIDSILDKISQSGYDSLTKEEKEFLFKASKKD